MYRLLWCSFIYDMVICLVNSALFISFYSAVLHVCFLHFCYVGDHGNSEVPFAISTSSHSNQGTFFYSNQTFPIPRLKHAGIIDSVSFGPTFLLIIVIPALGPSTIFFSFHLTHQFHLGDHSAKHSS